MTPVVHRLEAKYHDRVRFVYLDIDDPRTEPLKRALGFRVQPHFFLVGPDGTVLQQWAGAVDEAQLERAIRQALEGE